MLNVSHYTWRRVNGTYINAILHLLIRLTRINSTFLPFLLSPTIPNLFQRSHVILILGKLSINGAHKMFGKSAIFILLCQIVIIWRENDFSASEVMIENNRVVPAKKMCYFPLKTNQILLFLDIDQHGVDFCSFVVIMNL